MQAIFENEDEGDISGRASAVGAIVSAVDAIVCAGRVSRCVERKRNGGVRVREDRI